MMQHISWLQKALKISEAVSRFAVWSGGVLILLAALLIVTEIILRKTANVSTGGANELCGYALAISFTWSLSYTLLARAHVRVDVVYTWLNTGLRAILDCLGLFCLTGYACVLTYYCGKVLQDSLHLNSTSNTTLGVPLWIPQSLWLVGLILFSLTSMLLSIICLLALLTGDRASIFRLSGSRTTDDEIASNVDP